MSSTPKYGIDPEAAATRKPVEQPLLVITANTAWSLVNFRANLLLRLQEKFRLVALVPEDTSVEELRALGLDVRIVALDLRGKSVLSDLRLLFRYWNYLRQLKPTGLITYTIKPNIYGSLAARFHRIPVVNNVTGLGSTFGCGGPVEWIVSILYRVSLRRSKRVFFLNVNDYDEFLARGFVRREQAALLPGEGIDLKRFSPMPRTGPRELTFLLAARLIWEKGVGEYVAAARRLRESGKRVRFVLVGFIAPGDKSAVRSSDIDEWEKEGIIEFCGAASDVRPHIAAADCVVLPSWYREGLPRILMEAAAMEKPIITTDTPGCRETVEDGRTGFLCAPRSISSLVEGMSKFVALSARERAMMGRAGRSKMETDFDETKVIDTYLSELDRIGLQ